MQQCLGLDSLHANPLERLLPQQLDVPAAVVAADVAAAVAAAAVAVADVAAAVADAVAVAVAVADPTLPWAAAAAAAAVGVGALLQGVGCCPTGIAVERWCQQEHNQLRIQQGVWTLEGALSGPGLELQKSSGAWPNIYNTHTHICIYIYIYIYIYIHTNHHKHTSHIYKQHSSYTK